MTDRLEEAIGFLATRPEGALALAAVDSAISLRILAGRSVEGLDTASIAAPDNQVDSLPGTAPIVIQVPAEDVPTTPPRARRRGAGSVPPLDDTPAPETVADSSVSVPTSDEPKKFVDPLTAEFGDDFDDFDVNTRDTPPAVPLKSPDAKKPKPRATKKVDVEEVDAAIVENADGTVVGDGETIATLQPDDELDAILAQAAPKKKGKKKGKKGKKA